MPIEVSEKLFVMQYSDLFDSAYSEWQLLCFAIELMLLHGLLVCVSGDTKLTVALGRKGYQ